MISTLILIIYLYYCIHKCASMSPAFVHKHILINTCIMCLLYRLLHSHINSCFIWGAGGGYSESFNKSNKEQSSEKGVSNLTWYSDVNSL